MLEAERRQQLADRPLLARDLILAQRIALDDVRLPVQRGEAEVSVP